MLTIEEYSSYDATGLAELIKSGQVTASEVQEVALAAVELADERLGAVAEGPFPAPPPPAAASAVFAGVPFVLKDLLCHAAGIPVHSGSRALAAGAVFDHDSELMARFRRAGLALVASAKSPEFGLNAVTEPLLGGPACNPWDPARSPGGSSGGCAALVAAGAVPLAHANDGAGSIRIPAGHNGLVGLKPSRGRIPLGPDLQELMYGNVVEFAVTRSVRDSATLLDAVHGYSPGEKYGAPHPARPYSAEVGAEHSPLRIAWCADSWTSLPLDPDVERVLESTARLLESLGHHVEQVRPAIDWEAFLAALTTTFCAGTAASVIPLGEALGGGLSGDHFEASTIACAEAGRRVTPMDLERAFAINNTLSRVMGTFMQAWDVLLTPTAITPAVELGTFDSDDASLSAEQWVRKVIEPHPICPIYNVTGAPAISVPAGISADGLPIGVHLGAQMYREDLLLRLASQLEQAAPWSHRRPRLHVAGPAAVAAAR